MNTKQGYASKNWVKGLSDEAFYPGPGSHQKKFDLNGSALHLSLKKRKFDLLINGNLRVFQNHRKQAKINVVFHCFPSLGLNEPP